MNAYSKNQRGSRNDFYLGQSRSKLNLLLATQRINEKFTSTCTMTRPHQSQLQLQQRVTILEHQMTQLLPIVERVKMLECSRGQDGRRLEESLQMELMRERETKEILENQLENERQRFEIDRMNFESELTKERQKCKALEERCTELKDMEGERNSYKDKYERLTEFMRSAPMTNEERAMLAIKTRNSMILTVLLDMDLNIDTQYEGNLSLLHTAVTSGDMNIVKLIVQKGAHVNAKEKSGVTPLHEAAWCGHHEVCAYLISVGARVNQGNEDMETPLHYAARKGHLEVCNVLLKSGAKVNQCDRCKFTPLHEAAREGHLAVLKLLLEHSGDPMLQTNVGHTAYNMAYNNNCTEVVEYLSAAGYGDKSTN